MGEGQTRTLPPPLIDTGGHLLTKEKCVTSLKEAVDSATPGKPCVQNDMISGFRIEYETLQTTFIDR